LKLLWQQQEVGAGCPFLLQGVINEICEKFSGKLVWIWQKLGMRRHKNCLPCHFLRLENASQKMSSSSPQQPSFQGIPITVTRIEFHFAPVFIPPAGQQGAAPATAMPNFPFFGFPMPQQFFAPNAG
jgi:hypothetical protein